jgi:hypothetical protein
MKDYNTFLLESLKIDSDLLVTILKSLKSGENQQIVIDKIINKEDETTKKNILMSVVESNDIDLIDYMLQFKINLNHLDKKGKNVLFYCKNLETFKKIYELGADPKFISEGRSILYYLSSKKIFNVELYQKLIYDGVDINNVMEDGGSVLFNSINNKKIVQLLINNKVNLNNTDKDAIFRGLYYNLKYYPNKITNINKIFELLFDNGMEFNQVFFQTLSGALDYEHVFTFLKYNKRFFNENDIENLWKKMNNGFNIHYSENISKELMRLFESPKLYFMIKKYWGDQFYTKFADIAKEYYWLDESEKYNL